MKQETKKLIETKADSHIRTLYSEDILEDSDYQDEVTQARENFIAGYTKAITEAEKAEQTKAEPKPLQSENLTKEHIFDKWYKGCKFVVHKRMKPDILNLIDILSPPKSKTEQTNLEPAGFAVDGRFIEEWNRNALSNLTDDQIERMITLYDHPPTTTEQQQVGKEWISVKDSLPNRFLKCWICTKKGDLVGASLFNNENCGLSFFAYDNDDEEYTLDEVTHWMEIDPPPPPANQ